MGFKCPYCYSENIEVEDNTEVDWGNNDQGTTLETFKCEDCNRTFLARARVEVVNREYEFHYACPYCGDANEVEFDSEDPKQKIHWYLCKGCNRNFAVHTEEWYAERMGKEVSCQYVP